jgi:ATP adenylyltransferase
VAIIPGEEERSGVERETGRLDGLQRLWTPWRMSYIKGEGKDLEGCPFCVLPDLGSDRDREAFILHRGRWVYAILNAYPYNPGHLMVVPFRHFDAFDELTAEELLELSEVTQLAVRALRRASNPQGFNIGINMGAVGGAGIADHIHQHVVPRWGGDTNFMPVIGQTRVLPELLEEAYDRLVPAFATG